MHAGCCCQPAARVVAAAAAALALGRRGWLWSPLGDHSNGTLASLCHYGSSAMGMTSRVMSKLRVRSSPAIAFPSQQQWSGEGGASCPCYSFSCFSCSCEEAAIAIRQSTPSHHVRCRHAVASNPLGRPWPAFRSRFIPLDQRAAVRAASRRCTAQHWVPRVPAGGEPVDGGGGFDHLSFARLGRVLCGRLQCKNCSPALKRARQTLPRCH